MNCMNLINLIKALIGNISNISPTFFHKIDLRLRPDFR